MYLWYKKIYAHNSTIGLDIYKCFFYNSLNSFNGPLSSVQKCSFLLKYLLEYLQNRLETLIYSYPQSKILQSFEKLIFYFRILEVINLYAFIYKGTFRNLHERLFGIKVGIKSSDLNSQLMNHSYAFLNRELTWNVLIEVLAFLIPLLTNGSLYRKFISQLKIWFSGINDKKCDKLSYLDNRCHICQKPAINARCFANCWHIYCYFCIATLLMEQNEYKCSNCDISIFSQENLLEIYPKYNKKL